MSLTNFPYGVSSFGIPVIGAGPIVTTGLVFFVHNGVGTDANGRGTDPSRPFASIDYAVGKCRANKGDVIVAMPGHVETVVAAGGLDLDVAGITIIGLGNGDNRPQINFTTAVTADMDVDAADITIMNCRFTGGVDNITAMVDVNAARFSMINCEYADVTGQVAVFLLGDANADDLKIQGFKYKGDAAAGTSAAIQLNGSANFELSDFFIDGNFANAALEVITVAATGLYVHDGFARTRNAADLLVKDTITGSTGVFDHLLLSLQEDAANVTAAITGATFRLGAKVYVVNADNQKALAITWTEVANS